MAKKIKIFCSMLLLCVFSLLPLSRVHAKYVKELPIGTFNLSITSSEKTFAIYDETDHGLYIYKRQTLPADGQTTYDGKTVSALYTDDLESLEASSSGNIPWSAIAPNIVSVSFEDTIVPVSTSNWFIGFTNCTTFKLDKLDTSEVKDMSFMFTMCMTVSTLDLSGFNTRAVKNTEQMFAMCHQLTTIYASKDFVMDNVEDSNAMFGAYTSMALVGGEDTPWDEAITDKTYARIDGLNGEKGYFTCKHTYEGGSCVTCGKTQSIIVTTDDELTTVKNSGKDYTVQGGTYTQKILADGTNVVVDGAVEVESNIPLEVKGGGTLTVNDGEFTELDNNNTLIQIIDNSTMIINDGTFTSWVLAMGSTTGRLEINGGTFDVDVMNGYGYFGISTVGTIIIRGGTFTVNPSSGINVQIADGYEVVDNGDGTWTVAKAA